MSSAVNTQLPCTGIGQSSSLSHIRAPATHKTRLHGLRSISVLYLVSLWPPWVTYVGLWAWFNLHCGSDPDPEKQAGSEINTPQAPNAGRFSIRQVNLVRLSATLVSKGLYQKSNVINKRKNVLTLSNATVFCVFWCHLKHAASGCCLPIKNQ